MLILTTKQMKRAEKITDEMGVSYLEMMENAGRQANRFISEWYDAQDKSCVVLCGSGNNAGDGFVFANEYSKCGSDVTVVLCHGHPQTVDSDKTFQALREVSVEIIRLEQDPEAVTHKIDQADFVVDALYGTGFHGKLDPFIGSMLDYVNKSDVTRIALDVPSGINADSGIHDDIYFNADITLCFGALKPLHTIEASKACCGMIKVLNIGITDNVIYAVYNNTTILCDSLIKEILPKRSQNAHKGTYGRLLNIAGSAGMGGAAMMSTLSAMRCGAGTTTLAAPQALAQAVASHLMEAMTIGLPADSLGRISSDAAPVITSALTDKTACLIGCGLSVTDETHQIVEYVIQSSACSLVLDADALNCIRKKPDILLKAKSDVVITPHIGEMSRLTGLPVEEVMHDMCKTAKDFAQAYNCIVVLKSSRTVIATPSGELYQNTTGNAGLAKGGSGDVLAGMIASFLAQGISPVHSAICGVYIHGYTADVLQRRMSEYSILARDLIDEIPYALKRLGR